MSHVVLLKLSTDYTDYTDAVGDVARGGATRRAGSEVPRKWVPTNLWPTHFCSTSLSALGRPQAGPRATRNPWNPRNPWI